jgi:hypothetical protein
MQLKWFLAGLVGILLFSLVVLLGLAPPIPQAQPVSAQSHPQLTPTPNPGLIQRRPYLTSLTGTALVIQWTTATNVPGEVRMGASVYPATLRQLPSGVWQHEASISGLQPGTLYTYTVAVSGQPAYAAAFRAAPASGAVTFVAFGDSGNGSANQIAVRDRMVQTAFDLAVHTGDIAYDNGTYSEFEARYFGIYTALIDHLPFYLSPGNHEYHTNQAAPYLDLFVLPRQALRAYDQERYYSFDYGDVHFVALDTEAPLYYISSSVSDDMADWLALDLAATSQPWKVVFFHRPAYSSGQHGSQSDVQQKLVPVFEQGGVNLVINGHDHSYERTIPIRGGAPTPFNTGGIVYIVTGGGGRGLYPVGTSWFTAHSQSVHHFARLTLSGCQAQIQAINTSGAVFDNATLDRCPPTPTPTPSSFTYLPLVPTGLNDIALPLDVSATITGAESLALHIEAQAGTGFGSVQQLVRWDAPSQSFLAWSHEFGFGDNFALALGDPVFLITNGGPTSITFTGRAPDPGEVSFTLTPGQPLSDCALNFISLPFDQAAITGADLLADAIGTPSPPGPATVLQALDWNAPAQNFYAWSNVFTFGDNFATVPGYPYIVCVNETVPAVWP